MKMHHLSLLVVLLAFTFSESVVAQSPQRQLHIVPAPVSSVMGGGDFLLKPRTQIRVNRKEAKDVAQQLAISIDSSLGYKLAVSGTYSTHPAGAILLKLNAQKDTVLGVEGYRLEVTANGVTLSANQPAGLFYGVQSFLQMLPAGSRGAKGTTAAKVLIPGVKVMDYPRFGWRGLMLDVSRHFFSKEFLLKYIDQMAKYKFNTFHLHLADDQGWRIEIKGLPRLTEVGAWRVPRTGIWWSFLPPQPGEEATAGGFYTQDDIREIVRYAEARFITIVPEIDVPAHSLALITAYPELSCTKKQYAVNPGSRFVNESNVLCIANDSTWLVLDKIFTQIAALFPGKYIHVGGDEANRTWWGKDPKDQALMKKEGIKDLAEMQGYFEKRLEKMILSKGKRMIGWDEILEGGLAPEATVMSWRGMEGGIRAAQMGHEVVMTPSNFAYLDLYQGDPLIEPDTYSMLRLSTSYSFEPVPEGIDKKFILGGQGNLWTESVPDGRQAEYMTWPRGFALSEVFWSPKGKRNWPDFVRRMEWQFKYLDDAHVKYARSVYDPIITGVKGENDSLEVKLATEIQDLDIYYSFDNSNPDNYSPKYQGSPLEVPTGAGSIHVTTYRDGRQIGKQINFPLTELKNRLEK